MLPIQPSPIKLPSLSAAGTFRARPREICVLAGAFENTANSLFTYYSLQITFVPFLNVSQPATIPKKKTVNAQIFANLFRSFFLVLLFPFTFNFL